MWSKIKQLFKRERRQFNLVFVGLDKSGKTTLIKYLQGGGEGDLTTTPTLGADFHNMSVYNIRFYITDLGGQKDFRELWSKPIKDADLVVFIIDAIDRSRFTESNAELTKVIDNLPVRKNGSRIPLVVAGNKVDLLPDDKSVSRKRQEVYDVFNLERLTNSRNPWQMQMISAKRGDGLLDLMTWIYVTLTGKKIDTNTIFTEFLVLNLGGELILSRTKTLGEEVLAAGFLAAICAFAKSITKSEIKDLTLSDFKVLFHQELDLIGAIIMNVTGDANSAKNVLTNLMTKVRQLNVIKMSEEEKRQFYENSIISQILPPFA